MMGVSGSRKCVKIGLAVLIQYRRVTDTQPRCRSIYRAMRRAGKQEAQLLLTNPRDAFRGQSRSPTIVPLHMLGTFPLVQ